MARIHVRFVGFRQGHARSDGGGAVAKLVALKMAQRGGAGSAAGERSEPPRADARRHAMTGLWEKRTGPRLWSRPNDWVGAAVAGLLLEVGRYAIGGNPPRTAISATIGLPLLAALAVGIGSLRVGVSA